MYIQVDKFATIPPRRLAFKCPICGHNGTFDKTAAHDLMVDPGHESVGLRRCPNESCHANVFVVIDEINELIATFPPLRIDFEKEAIPEEILSVFEEAITCHAERCFRASAIMIRRTLEEICAERKAEGVDLKARIKALGGQIMIPKELLAGMHELRLLGNDAAHVESKDFEQVSKEEVEVGIEFAKEIIKAVYQYDHLLKRLQSLKKPRVE